MPQQVAQNYGLAFLLKTVRHTSHTKFLSLWKIQVDGPNLPVFGPISAENTPPKGVKSENKFCFIKKNARFIKCPLLYLLRSKIENFWKQRRARRVPILGDYVVSVPEACLLRTNPELGKLSRNWPVSIWDGR